MASSSKPPTKTEIFNGIAEVTGLNRKQVADVFGALATMIDKELSKGKKTDAKAFTIPGLCKIVTKYKAAEKGGEKKTNPFTGDVKLFAHFFQSMVGIHFDTKTHTKHFGFSGVECG